MAKRTPHESLAALNASIEDLQKQTHSAVVITLTSLMDVWLERVLKKALIPMSAKMHSKLFDAYRPLNTFAAKILITYAVGALTLETYEELERIRSIRNIFAHGTEIIDFDNTRVVALLATLKSPSAETTAPRDRFIASINGVREEMQAYLASSSSQS